MAGSGMTDIAWTNETRKLSELVPWERNPRQIKQDQAKRLNESLRDFGQPDVLAIGPNNEVYNGHQRLNVWAEQHGPDFEVDVRVSSRELSEKERERLTVLLHKGAAGDWDFDTLANEFELDELLEWGFSKWELGVGDELDLDFEPEESEAKGFRALTFSLLPEQLEAVEGAIDCASQDGAEYPGNEHVPSNALYQIALEYVSGR